jgi:hypothetical protein
MGGTGTSSITPESLSISWVWVPVDKKMSDDRCSARYYLEKRAGINFGTVLTKKKTETLESQLRQNPTKATKNPPPGGNWESTLLSPSARCP